MNLLIGDNFFKNNPDKILGTQSTRKGQYGNDVIVVEGNLSNIEKINAQPVAVVDLLPTMVQTTATEQEQTDIVFEKEFKKANDKKITELRTGKKKTKLAASAPQQECYSFAEIDAQYNKNITQDEKEAYYFTHPEFNWKLLFDEFTNTKQDFIDKDLVCFDDGKLVYVYTYKSGNVSKKLSHLQRDKIKIIEQFGQKQYDKQFEMLQSVKPKQKGFIGDEKITLLPHSNFAKEQKIAELKYGPELNSETTLFYAFQYWLRKLPPDEFKKSNYSEIIDYYLNNKSIQINKDNKEQKIKDEKNAINIRQRTKEEGDELFARFLANELLPEDQAKIAYLWNEKYNSIVEQDLTKVPVLFTMSKTFKNGLPLAISDTQRQAAAFNTEILSNGLAYGVGVGKTLASIVCFSQAYYSGFAKKPLFVVPTNTYDKWLGEIQGYTDKTTGVFMHGALPQLPPIKGLFNLNPTLVREELKDYSESDLQILESIQLAITAIKNLKADDIEIAKRDVISKIYPINWLGLIEDHKLYLADTKAANPKNFAEYTIGYLREEYNYYIYQLGTMKEFPDGTIFVTTEVGLQRLGVSSTDKQELQSKLYNILSQGEKSAVNERGGNDRAKEIAALELKIEQTISSSLKNAKINIDALGIDWACFDEAHLYKKLFTFVKGSITGESENYKTGEVENKREKSKYEIKSGSSPSSRALSAFVLSSYVQQKNNNRNVLMLTATPFTNSPLEVFSMLTLTNYKMLEDLGVDNMVDFFDTFMRIDYDIKLTAQKKVIKGVVLKGYNNLPQLRQIIYALWDKKDQGSGISRPDKIIYPSVEQKRETTLPMTAEQENLMRNVKAYINGNNEFEEICAAALQDEIDNMDFDGFDDEKLIDEWEQATDREYTGERENLDDKDRDKLIEQIKKAANKLTGKELSEDELSKEESAGVRILKGLSMMRQITLSPYLYYGACQKAKKEAKVLPNYLDYVKSSPKFLYAFGCIKSEMDFFAAKGLKQSGKVMYMNTGVDEFVLLKEYAVKQLGLKESQVGIVSGKMSKGAKEAVKQGFLRGDILLLIGSSTISVGVDLQNNSTTLFNLYYDWNPTDAQQIEGRIWRQGNRFAYVRIMYPQCYNSADPVIFEYLNSKTLRINEIWNRSSSVQELDLRDFNPKELQKKIITDPEEMAEWEILEQTDQISNQIIFFENRKQKLVDSVSSYREYLKLKPQVIEIMNTAASIKNDVARKEAIVNQKEKINEIVEKYGADIEKMGSEIAKYKASRYDYENDPEQKFVNIDYNEGGDEKIKSNVLKYIDLLKDLNWRSGDEWQKMYQKNTEYIKTLQQWYGAYKNMKAAEDKVLLPMGLTFGTAENPIEEFSNKLNALREQLETIEASKEPRIEQLKIQMAASAGSIKNIADRIAEFAADNEKYLLPQLHIPTKKDEVKKPVVVEETVVEVADEKMQKVKSLELGVKSEVESTKDLLGNPKEYFMLTKQEYLEAESIYIYVENNGFKTYNKFIKCNYIDKDKKFGDVYNAFKCNAISRKFGRTEQEYSIWIKEAIDNNKYISAIEQGKMTVEDAVKIIESAGLEVPKNIIATTETFGTFAGNVSAQKMENVIAHTNARLVDWYANAKDFGVIGEGVAKFNSSTNEVEIYYTENGVKHLFKHYWHPDFKIDTIFDIWQTEANAENDKIETEETFGTFAGNVSAQSMADAYIPNMPVKVGGYTDEEINAHRQQFGREPLNNRTEEQDIHFDKIKNEVAKVGWTVIPVVKNTTYQLYNRNNKRVADISIKGNKYVFYAIDGQKLMSGNDNVANAALKLAKEYFYATEVPYVSPYKTEIKPQENVAKEYVVKIENQPYSKTGKSFVVYEKHTDKPMYIGAETFEEVVDRFKQFHPNDSIELLDKKQVETPNTKPQTIVSDKQNIEKQIKGLEIALKFAVADEKTKIEKQVNALKISLKFI